MKKQHRNLAALLLLVIVASGCNHTPTSETGTEVITVNSFEAVPNPATADRNVNINIELENVGDSDADNVAARIFGPTFAGSAGDDRAWRSGNGEGINTEGARTLSFDNLRAEGENTPSIPKAQSISLTAPALGQNREIDYNFYSKIFYSYETRGNTDFRLVSGQRFQEEDMTRSQTELETTSGPIELEIRGTTPKIFYRDGSSPSDDVTSEMCVKVINEGTGTPFLNGEVNGPRVYDVSQGQRNTVELNIQDVANINFEAKNGGGNTVNVELVGGQEGFQCYTMEAESLANAEEQNVNTQITARYNYVKEDETTVTVEGRRGLDNTGDDNTNTGGDGDIGDENEYEYEWVGNQGSDAIVWDSTLSQLGYSESASGPEVENEACQYHEERGSGATFRENCEER